MTLVTSSPWNQFIKENQIMYIADQSYYWNDDKTIVVLEDDPRAAFLIIGKGQEMPEVEARRIGLVRDEAVTETPLEATAKSEVEVVKEEMQQNETKAETAPAENKANLAPPENKAAKHPHKSKGKR